MPIGTPHGTLDYKQVSKVTFVGASSNTVIDTTTGSLGVGVDSGGPTSNLHVVGDALITGNVSDLNVVSNVNMLHTSNTASIKLNSNVVTEFPRSKKLMKFPRVAMTGASAPTGYVASASSNYEDGTNSYYQLWKPFDGSIANDFGAWLSDNSPVTYSTSSPYNATSATGNSLSGITGGVGSRDGAWLKLELPHKIKLSEARLYGRNAANTERIDAGYIYGSIDDTNWTQIGEISVSGISSGNLSTYTDIVPLVILSTDTTNYYKYFIVQPTSLTHASGFAGIGQMEYYGTPEYDPEAHGTDVTVKSYPNVPNTDWLEVYYDAKDYTGTPTSIIDKSGNDITATANNITIDATYNSFEFTQSPKSNIIAENVTFVSGDESHSIVLWVRLKNGNANNLLFDYRVAGGTNTVGAATGLYILNSNKRLQFFHQGTDKSVDLDFEQNRWYHITGTYAGGGGFTGSKIYIDGVDVGGAMGGVDSTLVLPTTGTITIGDYLYAAIGLGDGSIANFRLFNRALTSDEIYQLYAYQKEDFGHSTNNMTLKAGRLGIGTSEPRAALDVRGDLFGPGIIQVQSTTFNGITSGSSNSFTTLPGLTTRITPKRPGSKILVLLNLFWSAASDAYFQGNVKRDGTVIAKQEGSVGSAAKTSFAMLNYDRPSYFLGNIGFSYLDDSNMGTGSIEYTVEVRNRGVAPSQSWYINYTSNTGDANRLTGVSTLTLIEIQQ